jgi:predicted ATP-dependent endonuclease of OLD family
MSKIKRITVHNFKAVADLTADFNGCTAIITGRNNAGKSSFLRGLFDRVRGIVPDEIVKQGEQQGFHEAELTTGEKLRWEFNDKGKEKLTYISEKDIRSSLTMELRKKFLPDVFNVDEFLTAPPKKQREVLQKLVGLDFTDIDKRYDIAYKDREDKNRRYNEQRIVFSNLEKPEEVVEVDMKELVNKKNEIRTNLNNLYQENKRKNELLRKDWNDKCEVERKRVQEHNKLQETRSTCWFTAKAAVEKLISCGYKGSEAGLFVQELQQQIQPDITYVAPAEPNYVQEMPDDTELKSIDEQINNVNENNRKAALWNDYLSKKSWLEDARTKSEEADVNVNNVNNERMELIKSANMPEGFSFNDDGILYNNLPFTREQLSSSGIYIAALKLAAMTLGEIRTLHFDASFLDKISLSGIQKWAEEQDLQLLVEMPDREGGDIQYELIQEHSSL